MRDMRDLVDLSRERNAIAREGNATNLRLAEGIETLVVMLMDSHEQKPTLTEETPPEPTPEPPEEPTPEPKQTRDELEKVVRKGLYAFQNRGGDPRALTFAILGNKLKTLEMDEDQLLAVLNHKEVQ